MNLLTFPKLEAPDIQEGQSIWIGDPCYVVEPWIEFCHLCSFSAKYNSITISNEGVTLHDKIQSLERPRLWNMIYWNTAFGDGNYELLNGNHSLGFCGVDAGMLAIIPMEALQNVSSDRLKLGIQTTAPSGKPLIANGDMLWESLRLNTSSEVESI
jgi:hypothetical protein